MTTADIKPPPQGASPTEIRGALLPEFDLQWRAALTAAADTLSFDEVHEPLECWRRVAWLITAYGPDGYRRMMATAQNTLRTDQSPPGTVGLAAVEALIRERLGR